MIEGRKRVVIENLRPEIDSGEFPVKRVIGERVTVTADIFADGHDAISAVLLFRRQSDRRWNEVPMEHLGNDLWRGTFLVQEIGHYYYTIEGWVDHFRTWVNDLEKKFKAQQDISVDALTGAGIIREAEKRAKGKDRKRLESFTESLSREKDAEKIVALALEKDLGMLMDRHPDRGFASRYGRELSVIVDRIRARFSSWYERFPRSCTDDPARHGTLKDCEKIIPEIAKMGFDVFYLPPIHPIGLKNRKGRNNIPAGGEGEAGSPWAIGSPAGGHTAIHPELGTMGDFESLIRKAEEHGIEIAMDLAFQCSPDHPYVKDHPEWFRMRPDGTIQYAENPPKKYEDIVPLNFETEDWQNLWNELKGVVTFWIGKGVNTFRVDNPHTKSLPFWEWLIREIKKDHPGTIFLSEAFTRPKVMYRLAKIGFTQSYTYFTWRNTKAEIELYMTELLRTEVREFFRPNFWPNTPDILPEHLQYGGRPAFIIRLVLAATLSSNYGVYGPPFELNWSEALPGKEEYRDSEKYEVKKWDWNREGNLKDVIALLNRVRKDNPALQTAWNLEFYETDNDYLIAYGKRDDESSNIIVVIVNLDPYHTQGGWVTIPAHEFGITHNQPYLVHDLLGDDKYIWHGERNFVQLDPFVMPAYIFRVRTHLKRESDFDYFM